MGFRYINSIVTQDNLKQFLELVDLAAGSGADTNNVFDLSEKFHPTLPMQRCIQSVKNHPASAQIIEEQYVGQPYNLEEMLKMPKHSLGWTYATILDTLGYDPQFYRTPSSFPTEADYITFRVYKTHDLHHILTGFSLDTFGEIGVITVTAAQIGYPTFVFVDIINLLFTFFRNDDLNHQDLSPQERARTLESQFGLMLKGLQMGRVAKPLFPVKWEEHFERPLAEVREELDLVPVTEGVYSWYSNPQLAAAIA